MGSDSEMGGNDRRKVVASNDGTLHLYSGELGFTETGERKKMECGALLTGIGHSYNEHMVTDHAKRGDICERCFPEIAEIRSTGSDRDG